MLPHDPTGKNGCATNQPDVITVKEPKEVRVHAVTRGAYVSPAARPPRGCL